MITVFAGIPARGTTTLWDRLCGEPNSVAMMHKRIHENESVFKKIGAAHYNLSYLDSQYPSVARDIEDIARSILAHAHENTVFYAPLASGRLRRHSDHITIRELGVFLLSQGKKVSFYADIPYTLMPAHPNQDYVRRISQRASQLVGINLSAKISELDDKDQVRKREAMKQYKSQYTMINIASLGALGRKTNVMREITFHVV